MNNSQLDRKIEELKKLCGELDPFNKISKGHKKLLTKYGLNEIADPFELSNRLILLVENAIMEQLNSNDNNKKSDETKSNPTIH